MNLRNLLLLPAALGWLVFGLLQPAQAQYLGEAIWSATLSETDDGPILSPPPITVIAGFTKVSSNYYNIQGRIITGLEEPIWFTGGGLLQGGTLILTCHSSQQPAKYNWRYGAVIHLELDITTLGGSFFAIGSDFDRSTRRFSSDYVAGSLTRTGGITNLP